MMYVYLEAKQQAAHGGEMYFGVSLYIHSQHSRSFLQEASLYLLTFRRVRTKKVWSKPRDLWL